VKSGKLLYVARNFPLESIHSLSEKAAEAAECMGDQGKYWQAHDSFFKRQQALDAKELPGHALVLGADVGQFKRCLDSGKYTKKILNDVADGAALEVRGTPTFFFGHVDSTNTKRIQVLELMSGAQPLEAFKNVIDKLLNAEKE